MAWTIDVDGERFIHISYLKLANNNSERRGERIKRFQKLISDILDSNLPIEVREMIESELSEINNE